MPCQLQLEVSSSDQQYQYQCLYHLRISLENLSTSLHFAPETEPPETTRSSDSTVDLSHQRQRSVEPHHTALSLRRRTPTPKRPTIYKHKQTPYKQESITFRARAAGIELNQKYRVKRYHKADYAKRGHCQRGQRQGCGFLPSYRLRQGPAYSDYLLGRRTNHRPGTRDVPSDKKCGFLSLDVAPLSHTSFGKSAPLGVTPTRHGHCRQA